MAAYSWLAVDKKGSEKKGTMDADSVQAVYDFLKGSGLLPVKVKEQSILTKDISLSFGGGKVKPRELAVFCRQFVSIINAGVPMKRALQMLGEQTENKILKEGIREVMLRLEGGSSLSEAMASQDKVFPAMLANMAAAGESAGNLSTPFLRMAAHFEKDAHLKSMIKKATIYPVVLLIVAVAVLFVMLGFVIPQFANMFSQIDAQMPAITQAVMSASRFTVTYWYLILALFIGMVIVWKLFASSKSGRFFVDSMKMKIPVFGKLIVKSSCSKMARMLSTLLAAGIPLVESLEITSKNLPNVHFKELMLLAREEVMRGIPLSKPLMQSKIMPPVVYHMIGIGEETGTVEEMMDKLADYYDEEVEVATQSVMAAIEPMIVVVMALVIGFLVISVILPMTTLYNGLM